MGREWSHFGKYPKRPPLSLPPPYSVFSWVVGRWEIDAGEEETGEEGNVRVRTICELAAEAKMIFAQGNHRTLFGRKERKVRSAPECRTQRTVELITYSRAAPLPHLPLLI